MMVSRLLALVLLHIKFNPLYGQTHFFEFGLGPKYDRFSIQQSEPVFSLNTDLGAAVFLSYSRELNKKLNWEMGLANNNYKINFDLYFKEPDFYITRELVSVMRSNRVFMNLAHKTSKLNQKFNWVNSAGFSIIFGAKNPYDVILQRHKEIVMGTSTETIDLKIKTFGLTGSAILLNAGTKLYYSQNTKLQFLIHLELMSGIGELTKVEIDYVLGSAPNYKKAIISSNGTSFAFKIGALYCLENNK